MMSTTYDFQHNDSREQYDITNEQIEKIRWSANHDCPCQELAQSILEVVDG